MYMSFDTENIGTLDAAILRTIADQLENQRTPSAAEEIKAATVLKAKPAPEPAEEDDEPAPAPKAKPAPAPKAAPAPEPKAAPAPEPKAKPAPAPKAAPEDEDEDGTNLIDQAKDAARAAFAAGGSESVRAALAAVGGKRVSELTEDQAREFIIELA